MTDHGADRTARWRGWLRERPLVADGLLAAALFGVQLALWSAFPREPGQAGFAAVAALTAAELAFVVIRRRWPWVAAVGVSLVAVTSLLALSPADGGGGLGFLVVAYTTAAYLGLRPAILATLVLWLPGLVLTAAAPERPPVLAEVPGWYLLVYEVMVAAICFCVGRVVHTRRAYTAALEERAAAAEANQRALAAHAVAEERRRIARELHDLVAHHVAVMGVLATGARRAAGRDPAIGGGAWEPIDEALATIEATGRTVLRELRRLLDVLRSDSDTGGGGGWAGEEPELAPQPGLAAVAALVEQVREAGLPVTLRVEGEPEPLDPGVALAVYRIVQEALTNVLRHAGPATAEVRIARRGPRLQVEVFDTGRGPAPGRDPAGLGLVSMRERVHLLGGTLRAGARPGGGFRVFAKIPADQLAELP